jgi:hypothetical protein
LLNFTIEATVISTSTYGNVTTFGITKIRETRLITLVIYEVSEEAAESFLNKSAELIGEMEAAGLNVEEITYLYQQAQSLLEDKEYEQVLEIYETIEDLKEKAFETLDLVEEVSSLLEEAKSKGLKTPKTERLVRLAQAALERGDYATALERANDAKLTYALETSGKFNLPAYVKNNWPKLIVAAIILAILSYFAFLSLKYTLVKNKLRELKEEEKVLLGLIKEVQRECFERGKLSMDEYVESIMQYEKRISKVVQEIIELETVKANIFKFKPEDTRLIEERKRLLDLMKETQQLYLQSKKMETHVYESRMRSYAEKLAEVEERLATLEAEKAINET